MLSVILKILSILGILLLGLLVLAVLLLFLALFFPISYQLTGKKDPEKTAFSARVSWLFGVLRIRFDYPEPGRVLVKVLPFTVFDSGKISGAEEDPGGVRGKKRNKRAVAEENDSKPSEASLAETGNTGRNGTETENTEQNVIEAENTGQKGAGTESTGQKGAGTESTGQKGAGAGTGKKGAEAESTGKEDTETEGAAAGNESSDNPDDGEADGSVIVKKIKKIKYTICSIYDKIKNIWENISYYIELLQEEETRLLFSHVIFRLGKIWKSIRPRHIRGQILFGTGSPDTTGYAFGVYGMLSPFLGSRLYVTPDFARAVLEGDICLSGHITVFTLLWNGLKILLDKKTKRFIKKMKAGRKK